MPHCLYLLCDSIPGVNFKFVASLAHFACPRISHSCALFFCFLIMALSRARRIDIGDEVTASDKHKLAYAREARGMEDPWVETCGTDRLVAEVSFTLSVVFHACVVCVAGNRLDSEQDR